MFVNIVEFPPIVAGKEQEFEDWFAWSNELYQPFAGFVSRRLLKPTRADGPYVGIVEHESEETFMAMHTSDTREQAREKVEDCFGGGRPTPRFYAVVVDSAGAATAA